MKLKVRDAVLQGIHSDLEKIADLSEAKEYLQEQLPRIREIVRNTLEENGFSCESAVTLCKEAFPIRYYDTFTLPAGVYDSLRIVIGPGEGRNWWCIAFPELCIPATRSDFREAAVSAGFSRGTAEALSGRESYRVRFYLLEQLGNLENILFTG